MCVVIDTPSEIDETAQQLKSLSQVQCLNPTVEKEADSCKVVF